MNWANEGKRDVYPARLALRYDDSMAREGGRRGVSKAEWLEAALDVLAHGGIEDVSIDGLARHLGIAKSGFYWHFKNRRELHEALLDYWVHEVTEVISENPKVKELPPRDRLVKVAEMIHDNNLLAYEYGIRQWARRDKAVARAVRKANRLRYRIIEQAFQELGFEDDELTMRSMLFVCYHSSEGAFFPEIPRKRRRELISRRIDFLTSGTLAATD